MNGNFCGNPAIAQRPGNGDLPLDLGLLSGANIRIAERRVSQRCGQPENMHVGQEGTEVYTSDFIEFHDFTEHYQKAH
jgi:hypothetical protein